MTDTFLSRDLDVPVHQIQRTICIFLGFGYESLYGRTVRALDNGAKGMEGLLLEDCGEDTNEGVVFSPAFTLL